MHLPQCGLAAVDLLLQPRVGDVGEVVQVEVGVAGHGQHRPSLGVQHHAGGAVLRQELVHQPLQPLFQIILHRGVQGGDDVVAVVGVEILLVFIQHVVAGVVLGGDDQAGFALQLALILRLQAVEARVVVPHEADDVGRQAAVGVVPLGVGHQIHAVDFILVYVLPHPVGHVLLGPQLQHLVLGVGAVHLFQNGLLADLQNLTEGGGQSLPGPGGGVFLVV